MLHYRTYHAMSFTKSFKYCRAFNAKTHHSQFVYAFFITRAQHPHYHGRRSLRHARNKEKRLFEAQLRTEQPAAAILLNIK